MEYQELLKKKGELRDGSEAPLSFYLRDYPCPRGIGFSPSVACEKLSPGGTMNYGPFA